MTNQEAFTRIVQHLRQQNSKSMAAGGVCQYRDDAHRRRCAVGVLITDEFYTPAMEGITLALCMSNPTSWLGTPMAGVFRPFLESMAPVSFDLLRRMQELHDRIRISEWETGFIQIANRFDLTVPLREEWPTNQPESLAQVEEAFAVEHTMEALCTTK